MNERLKLSGKNDVLNNETSNQDIENELLTTDTITFSFNFANFGPPKNSTLKITKNG